MALSELRDQPWWTAADEAELDLLVHELVRGRLRSPCTVHRLQRRSLVLSHARRARCAARVARRSRLAIEGGVASVARERGGVSEANALAVALTSAERDLPLSALVLLEEFDASREQTRPVRELLEKAMTVKEARQAVAEMSA
jgi:hypothetical protein